MKFNYKSKLGFTLIELLVVIGILAVLAAIAIPSVAGLIDRANVSADATNANEMTNAVERFTSEYELYLQDIASGRLDTTNLDSAQGRVFNVTGVTDRAGIEGLEKDASAGVDTTGKAIYRDTKYPVNAETMQAVVENYMKTSSTTFTPKQSDCHYYYSPDCGLVVCTEINKSTVNDLNKLVQSGKDAKGKDLGTSTKWIDLTTEIVLDNENSSHNNDLAPIAAPAYGTNDPSLNHNGIIPEGALYFSSSNTHLTEDGFFVEGDAFPEFNKNYDMHYNPDIYYYGDYTYYANDSSTGWYVTVDNKSKKEYGIILESINGKPVIDLSYTFNGCTEMIKAPAFPNTIAYATGAFYNCTNLLVGADMSKTTLLENMDNMYENCSSLVFVPAIPDTVLCGIMPFNGCTSLTTAPAIHDNLSLSYFFYGCANLKTYAGSMDADGDFSNFKLPSSSESLRSAFNGCKSITKAPIIPNTVDDMDYCFENCTGLTQKPTIPSSVTSSEAIIFNGCTQFGFPYDENL